METVIGIIAEDVEKIYPCAVERDENTGQVINWMERYLLPPMLSLIKEQHAQIKKLELANMELNMKIELMNEKLKNMEEKSC